MRDEERLAVVQAPPGSGKTHLLLRAVEEAFGRKQRVAIATQTRSQADDICRRLVQDFGLPPFGSWRRVASRPNVPDGIQVLSDKKQLPTGPCIVVATTAKWG